MNKLKMTYKADSGRNTSITLAGPRAGLSDGDVNTLMDAFVASGAVRTAAGKVVEKISCVLYKVTAYPFDLN